MVSPDYTDSSPEQEISFTVFKDVKGTKLEVLTLSWSDVVDKLTNPPTYMRKQDCPLLAMRLFDGTRTEQGSLRHAQGVVEVTAIEADFDQGDIEVDEALQRLTDANLKALVYSTPSHHELTDAGEPKGSRWRVVCPLSAPIEPDQRSEYVAMLNFIFDGRLAPESFSLGQSYFFGKVHNVKFEAGTSQGRCIDTVHMLESLPKAYPLHIPTQGPRQIELIDPTLKPGPVGAFTRHFTPEDVLGELLAPRFEHVRDNRWTWTERDAAGGIWVNGNHIGGSHAHWPGGQGRLLTSFDTFRLFMFNDGEPETETDQAVPMHQRPSYIATLNWMRQQGVTWHDADAAPSVQEIDALVEQMQNAAPDSEQAKQAYTLLKFDEVTALPSVSWQVKNLLPAKGLTMVFGQSGSGKSFWVLDLALAIARGHDYGHASAAKKTQQGKVLVVAAEGFGGMSQRLKAYANRYGTDDLAPEDFRVLGAAPDISVAQDIARLRHAIDTQMGHVDLIVLDTLSATTPSISDENSKEMNRPLATANQLIEHYGCSVLIVHHSGKNKAAGARGWSGLKGAVDAEIEITREESKGQRAWQAHVTKAKDGEDGQRLGFELISQTVGLDADNEPVTSLCVEHLESVVEFKEDEPSLMSKLSDLQVAVVEILYDHGGDGWVSHAEIANRIGEKLGVKPRNGNVARALDRLQKHKQELEIDVRRRSGDNLVWEAKCVA